MDAPVAVFLLAGQSNMAGRGRLDDVEPIHDPRIMMFRDGAWRVATEPLHTDRPDIAGVGLAMSFARRIVSYFDAPAGLVPCAVGGSSLDQWAPGAELFENAAAAALDAIQGKNLCGILWHQGETDACDPDRARTYGARFSASMMALRQRLGAPDALVLAGELGSYLHKNDAARHFALINSQLSRLQRSLPAYRCVSSAGLLAHDDNLHFDAKSLRAFGERYADAFIAYSRGAGSVPAH
jgi:hypothetical protein